MHRPTPDRARGLPHGWLLLSSLLLLTGCGGSDGGTDPDPDPDPDPSISVTVGSSPLSIEQGQSGSATVSVARSGGFSGAVTVTATNLPSGVTSTPATVAGGAGSGSIGFTAASNAAVGTTDVTLTATGQGVSATTTLQLEITEAPIGSFSIALEPTSVTIDEVTAPAISDGPAPAPDATVTVEITRESPFDGAVELSITGVPNDLQASFAESSVAESSTSLTVEATAGLAPGGYTLTVTGTADGLPNATAELQVTVEDSGSGGSLQVEICDASWFAYKDGDDPWTRVMAGGNGDQFSFDASSDRIGISWVQIVNLPGGMGTVPNVEIAFLARSELMGFQDPCSSVPGGKTITGTVTGFGGADLATVHLGFVNAFTAPGFPSFSLEGVPEGPLDLMAVRSSEGPGSGEITADRVLLRRDQDLADGTNLTLDLEGSEAFPLGTADLTLVGLGMGDHSVSVAFQSVGNLFTGGLATRVNSGSPVTVPVVPADRRESGDLHVLLLSEANRTVYQYRADPDGAMLELGPALAAVDVSYTTSGGAVLPSVTFIPQTEYDDWYSVTFSQLVGLTGIDVDVLATGAYLDGDTPVLTVPDFSAVDGWSTDWELSPGFAIDWNASAVDGLYEFIFPEDGTTLRLGTAEGTINP